MTLPNFLICGAQKAGTTALYEYLDAHPNVFMSKPKETEFFNRHYEKGWAWFSSHFSEYQNESAIGEASTRTMTVTDAPKHICERMPDAKLIFLLRNPVERAFSAYYFKLLNGSIDSSMAFGSLIRHARCLAEREIVGFGRYADQLKYFDEYFDPAQMKIILYEDFRNHTSTTMRKIFEYIGVDPTFGNSIKKSSNVTRYPISRNVYFWIRKFSKPFAKVGDYLMPHAIDTMRSGVRSLMFTLRRPVIREEDRIYLQAIYRESNARLEKRIGRSLAHWR